MRNIRLYIVLCICIIVHTASSSAIPLDEGTGIPISKNNNIITLEDTIRGGKLPKEYESLKKQSSKNKWTKKLFSLVVNDSDPSEKKGKKINTIDEYKVFSGKIIRNIDITVLDPFGTDIHNPVQRNEDYKFLNKTHVLTHAATIRSIIQFKKGMSVNPALIMESEAQLRNTQYIYDARIMIDSIPYCNDSVDVSIVVRDKWTLGIGIHNLSPSKVNFEVFDGNILGSGSRAGIDFIYSNKYKQKFGYGLNYIYRNVAHSNIDLGGKFIDRIYSYEYSFSAERKLQPKYKYFGQAEYNRRIIRPEVASWDSISPERNEKLSITIGRTFTLSEEYSIRQLALSLRYISKQPSYHNAVYQNYIKDIQLPYKYSKNRILLFQGSLYQNSYQREYMIYNFGTTENVAQGYNISTQLGYSFFDNIENAFYGSLSVSYGTNKLIEGNIYLNSALSSFYNGEEAFGGVFNFDAKYFTPLKPIFDWRFRQFITLNYSKLLQPNRYFGDRIYMGEHTTLPMRDWRRGSKGIQQFLIKSETDVFSNYQIAGFRLLFYSFFDMGWITPDENLFNKKHFNYGVGVGIRLRNNFIILNTIDIKIGLYPKLNQSGFSSFFDISSSTPEVSPNFNPRLPEEILVE